MKTTKTPAPLSLRGPLYSVALAALLVPGLAWAQSDPGLAQPAPAAAPATTPAPAEPATAPTTAPAATPAPAELPADARLVKEEKTESSEVVPVDGNTDEVWRQRLAAPSLSGGIGLLHMLTAEVGLPAHFRVATHFQGFTAKSFLIAGNGQPGSADKDSRFMGDLTLSLTGPDVVFLRNLELYIGVFNRSNLNERKEYEAPGRSDPAVILSLADVGAGLKGAWEVIKGFSLGANVGVRFMNSINGQTADFSGTSADFNALALFDVQKYAAKVPLRFHLNLGYYLDNSRKLLPKGQCADSVANDACIRSRLVETFAYGFNASRVRFALAAEAPIIFHYGKDGRVGLAPFVEYHLEAATSADNTLGSALLNQADLDTASNCSGGGCVKKGDVNNRVSQYVTLGARVRPAAGLIVDLGLDLGVQSPGYKYGPALPPWNFIVGLAYAYDFLGSTKTVVTRTINRTYETSPPVGKVAAEVKDAHTGQPVAGALVTYADASLSAQSTDDQGRVTSYGLPAGPTTLHIAHPDYNPADANTSIAVGETAPLAVQLTPLPPKEGKLTVRVVDDKGNPILGATAGTRGSAVSRDATREGNSLVLSLPAGDYSIAVDAVNYLSKERQVKVEANGHQEIEVALTKKPTKSHVVLTSDAIVIKGTIHFATNKATILPDGQHILDEVVDVLAKNPQVTRVSVEGHTDNVGKAEKNLRLSRDRAAAVVDYMVKAGIAPERLTSTGFGAEKPLVPNISPANRAKNRRVEFRIIK